MKSCHYFLCLLTISSHIRRLETVDTDFDLKVDNTWGDGHADIGNDDLNDALSDFIIGTSLEYSQYILDKRDGSHWELFNCNHAVSEEEQTI